MRAQGEGYDTSNWSVPSLVRNVLYPSPSSSPNPTRCRTCCHPSPVRPSSQLVWSFSLTWTFVTSASILTHSQRGRRYVSLRTIDLINLSNCGRKTFGQIIMVFLVDKVECLGFPFLTGLSLFTFSFSNHWPFKAILMIEKQAKTWNFVQLTQVRKLSLWYFWCLTTYDRQASYFIVITFWPFRYRWYSEWVNFKWRNLSFSIYLGK